MPRTFSIVIILAVSTMLLPGNFISAQETNSSCKKCPTQQGTNLRTIEFALPKIGFPNGSVTIQCDTISAGQSESNKEIEIRCECDFCEVPFLANLPYVNRLFKNVGISADHSCTACDKDTQSCTDDSCCAGGCSIAQSATKGCCGDDCNVAQSETKGCCGGDCNVAQSATKSCCGEDCQLAQSTTKDCCGDDCNVAQSATKSCGGEDCQLAQSATKPCCGDDCNVAQSATRSSCANPARVELAQFVEVRQDADKESDEMIELRIENQRLHAQLEAAEDRIDMMREMCKVREENAELRARIELMERHHAHTMQPNRHSPTSLAIPQQVTRQKLLETHPNHPHMIIGHSKTATPHLSPPKSAKNQTHAPVMSATHVTVPKLIRLPPGPLFAPASNLKQVREFARLTEHVKQLQKELKAAKKTMTADAGATGSGDCKK